MITVIAKDAGPRKHIKARGMERDVRALLTQAELQGRFYYCFWRESQFAELDAMGHSDIVWFMLDDRQPGYVCAVRSYEGKYRFVVIWPADNASSDVNAIQEALTNLSSVMTLNRMLNAVKTTNYGQLEVKDQTTRSVFVQCVIECLADSGIFGWDRSQLQSIYGRIDRERREDDSKYSLPGFGAMLQLYFTKVEGDIFIPNDSLWSEATKFVQVIASLPPVLRGNIEVFACYQRAIIELLERMQTEHSNLISGSERSVNRASRLQNLETAAALRRDPIAKRIASLRLQIAGLEDELASIVTQEVQAQARRQESEREWDRQSRLSRFLASSLTPSALDLLELTKGSLDQQ